MAGVPEAASQHNEQNGIVEDLEESKKEENANINSIPSKELCFEDVPKVGLPSEDCQTWEEVMSSTDPARPESCLIPARNDEIDDVKSILLFEPCSSPEILAAPSAAVQQTNEQTGLDLVASENLVEGSLGNTQTGVEGGRNNSPEISVDNNSSVVESKEDVNNSHQDSTLSEISCHVPTNMPAAPVTSEVLVSSPCDSKLLLEETCATATGQKQMEECCDTSDPMTPTMAINETSESPTKDVPEAETLLVDLKNISMEFNEEKDIPTELPKKEITSGSKECPHAKEVLGEVEPSSVEMRCDSSRGSTLEIRSHAISEFFAFLDADSETIGDTPTLPAEDNSTARGATNEETRTSVNRGGTRTSEPHPSSVPTEDEASKKISDCTDTISSSDSKYSAQNSEGSSMTSSCADLSDSSSTDGGGKVSINILFRTILNI